MCDWEEFLFTCSHSVVRLKSYCHFARNDPNHQCFGVKVLRKSWQQAIPCEQCIARWHENSQQQFGQSLLRAPGRQ
ncbi:hypothetical protein SODALDRAFT_204286 [Sodiomyces alkalinus F11]|uniref:Uncharacterized protein n=1 Tax=Sodiomyces alkalinus (strain CBS 110278 / VKM F-3762 / F11) TaxID=1314773 RepID=A0A3N2PT90_SODAK|nr:hypothetical protein SODALDRAFT_204286 [Sodiomyces alkalinus F11]ROT37727.1 hypothetical protein SODALDRAFT_204286 [Sodiomyces alkalinus F11]